MKYYEKENYMPYMLKAMEIKFGLSSQVFQGIIRNRTIAKRQHGVKYHECCLSIKYTHDEAKEKIQGQEDLHKMAISKLSIEILHFREAIIIGRDVEFRCAHERGLFTHITFPNSDRIVK